MRSRLALLALLLASALRASETPESIVQDKLLTPLAKQESMRGRFSRARPPAAERKLRMLDAAPVADRKGAAFVGFAVDARWSRGDEPWTADVIVGCVYPDTGEIYLRYGKRFGAASGLLGKGIQPAAEHICKAAGQGWITSARAKR